MFNPNDHMMKLKGKDYLQVMWRLVWFREEHKDWGIEANALQITEDHAVFKAIITDENGTQKSVGHGSESKRDFGDFIEKAETKAIGRALGMLGYGTQFAGDEFDEGERIVDSPAKVLTREPEMIPVKMPDIQQAPAKVEVSNALPYNAGAEIIAFMKQYDIAKDAFKNMYQTLVAGGVIEDKKREDMTKQDVERLENAILKNFSGVVK